jgi:hypothetical protein
MSIRKTPQIHWENPAAKLLREKECCAKRFGEPNPIDKLVTPQNINATITSYGETKLHLAVLYKCKLCVCKLLVGGASPYIKTRNGCDTFDYAVHSNDSYILERLWDHYKTNGDYKNAIRCGSIVINHMIDTSKQMWKIQ